MTNDSMNELQSFDELKSFDEVFADGDRVFVIPDYQRGYSWEKQHRADLLRDIEYLIESGYEYRHYTGTIVATSSKSGRRHAEEGRYQVFDIVDGQQRMTSLVLLLSVICRLAKNSKEKNDGAHAEIFSQFIKGGPVERPVRKLKLGPEQDRVFELLVEEGITTAKKVSTKSDQNLINAIEEYEEWLNPRDPETDGPDIDDVLKCVRKQLGFLVYAPKNTKEIGIMFEVINNRGKALSELEKIKNYLIYYADKNNNLAVKQAVNRSWPEMLSDLNEIEYTSNEDEDRFLRNCWIVFKDTHKSRSHDVYANLKLEWPPDCKSTEEILRFIKFLEEAARFYAMYLKQEYVEDRNEKRWLERISYHPADASITPLILAIFSKVADQEERNGLFELLEKLNFRYYGTGMAGRSDSGQGELFRYANVFFNHFGTELEGERIDVQWLTCRLRGFISDQAKDKSFVKHLTLDKDEAGDYYYWVGLKFFLASYEEFIRKESGESFDLKKALASSDPDNPNDFYHKEHIWARQDYTKIDDQHDQDVNKRRLGNFLLLKAVLNLSVSNNPPEEKIRLYFENQKTDPNTRMIRELKDLFEEAIEDVKVIEAEQFPNGRKHKTGPYWIKVYKRFLDKREEKMVNFALERWKVPELSGNIKEVKLDSLAERNEIYSIDPD